MNTLLLYIVIGCHWCELAEIDLKNNCVPYKTSTGYTEIASVRPIAKVDKLIMIGYDQISEYAKSHNQCKGIRK